MGRDKTASTHFANEKIKHPTFLVELPVEYHRAPDSPIRPGQIVNFSDDKLMVSASEKKGMQQDYM